MALPRDTGKRERRKHGWSFYATWKELECQCGTLFWSAPGAKPKSCGCLLTPAQKRQKEARASGTAGR